MKLAKSQSGINRNDLIRFLSEINLDDPVKSFPLLGKTYHTDEGFTIRDRQIIIKISDSGKINEIWVNKV
jgi:hypothetical protein